MAKAMAALAAMFLVACGGTEGLTGEITVRLVWHGAWSESDQAKISTFVDGLAPAGYFAGFAERKLVPSYRVVGSTDARLTVDLWAPEADGAPSSEATGRLAWHTGDEGSGSLAITVTPTACASWQEAAYILAHELVETASDPWVQSRAREIADPCVFEGFALFTIAGAEQRAPKYMTSAGCWPRQ